MQAFSHSDNLILAVIGAGIESMGANVFSSALRKVTMKAAVPPESGDTFFGLDINTVYVPAASVELYKTADKFSFYEKFITAMPSVTFNSQGGSEIPSIIDIPYGMTIKEPASPTYEFYTFEGWYLEAECQNRFEFQTAVITENITLYANWLSF